METSINIPEGAVCVRADEVRPGDQLVVDGEMVGTVKYSDAPGWGHGRVWFLGVERPADSCGRDRFRQPSELVWVVRPEPTVTLTITLPERMVRMNVASAAWGVDNPYGLGRFEAACRKWAAAHPQDGDPK